VHSRTSRKPTAVLSFALSTKQIALTVKDDAYLGGNEDEFHPKEIDVYTSDEEDYPEEENMSDSDVHVIMVI